MVELPKKGKKIIITRTPKGPGLPPGRSMWTQGILALVIFFLLASIYSTIANNSDVREEISISTLAQDVTLGRVTSILVTGDKLDVTYIDGAEKTAKKE